MKAPKNVSIELVSGTDRMGTFQDIDQAINRITTFPDDIEEPEVRLQSNQQEVMTIGIYGDSDIWTLRQLAENIRDQLLNSEEITQVEIGNVPDFVTHVEIPRDKLRQYDLTLGEISDIIAQSSEDIPAGAVETSAGEILLRMQERKQWADEKRVAPLRWAIWQKLQMVLKRLVSTVNLIKFPGITWSFEGSQAEMRESTQTLWSGFALAMIVIYALLAIVFGSYTQPLIVMGTIPFGIIGAIIGHILLGYDLSLVSLMGLIVLSGVVLNDSLIMIDLANKKRADQSAFGAIREAGLRRFRPIILTTLTTFGGLTPIILETSSQAYHLVPMAISLGFGIVFATSIILVIVPCLYMILEDTVSALKTI